MPEPSPPMGSTDPAPDATTHAEDTETELLRARAEIRPALESQLPSLPSPNAEDAPHAEPGPEVAPSAGQPGALEQPRATEPDMPVLPPQDSPEVDEARASAGERRTVQGAQEAPGGPCSPTRRDGGSAGHLLESELGREDGNAMPRPTAPHTGTHRPSDFHATVGRMASTDPAPVLKVERHGGGADPQLQPRALLRGERGLPAVGPSYDLAGHRFPCRREGH